MACVRRGEQTLATSASHTSSPSPMRHPTANEHKPSLSSVLCPQSPLSFIKRCRLETWGDLGRVRDVGYPLGNPDWSISNDSVNQGGFELFWFQGNTNMTCIFSFLFFLYFVFIITISHFFIIISKYLFFYYLGYC